ncbi:MAG TPA: tetratricopeptide repeat protein [Leptolyngbyaceae cyanobacterium]
MTTRDRKKKINILPTNLTQSKTFNLLSIGQRGVGKTVFMIGSYEELQSNHLTTQRQKLWFDCQNDQVQENIQKILNYVVQTNQYPPPTMKIVNFNFSLKKQSFWGEQTLCHFQWNDIPGEICDIHNLEFRNMVFNSHGCCVFIDAYAMRHSDAYVQVLDDIFEQVMALTSLVYLNGLKYPLAIILTKSDLLENNSSTQQIITKKLQPLTTHLNAVQANYQIFQSFIPLIHNNGGVRIEAKGAAVSLLWVVWELNKVHNPGLDNQLLALVNRILPSNYQLPLKQELPNSTIQNIFSTEPVQVESRNNSSFITNRLFRNRALLLYIFLGSVTTLLVFLVGYQRFFQPEPNQASSIENLQALQESGQFQQAIQLLEQMIQREPERIDLRLQLAQLFELTGKVADAEIVYDQILSKRNDNLKALVGKAVLRHVQGDTKSASALFAQAEKVAPEALKSQVRAVANNTLRSSNTQSQDK